MKRTKLNVMQVAIKSLLVIAICSFGALSVDAQVIFEGMSSPAAAITDDGYDGTQGSMTCDAINIAGIPPGATINNITIDLEANHTWVGDLTIKLYAPNGDLVGLMSRPGFAEPADDGMGCCGDSSNLEDANTLNWDDANPTSAEDMGSTILGTQVVCAEDGFCAYFPAPDQISGQATFAAMIGALGDSANSNGDWTLCIGDGAGGDVGQLTSWAIRIDSSAAEIVPTLGEWSLIVLAMLLLIVAVVAVRSRQNVLQTQKAKA